MIAVHGAHDKFGQSVWKRKNNTTVLPLSRGNDLSVRAPKKSLQVLLMSLPQKA